MSHQADIIMAAIEEGLDPSELDGPTHARLAIKVRTLKEKIIDGTKQRTARLKVATGIGVFPLWVGEDNLKICRSGVCGYFGILTDGIEVCHRCSCQGPDLYNKVIQKNSYCPAPQRYWDNRIIKLTINKSANA